MKEMFTFLTRPALRGLVLALAALALSSYVSSAHPFASGITNTAGTISFILNETADTVGVYFPDNNSTNYLGANLAPGVHTFNLGAGTNAYVITVKKAGAGHITQISSDSTPLNTWLFNHSPRGVAVNANPQTHNFGRIYITDANSASRGLHVINADQSDALGYGTTAQAPGVTYQASSYSPFRCYVGPDDTVFAGSATTLANGGFLAYMNPDMTSGGLALVGTYNSWVPGETHTLIIGTPSATGSLAGGNLVIRCMDALYQQAPANGLSILEWDINGGPYPSSVVPTVLGVSGLGAFQTVSDSFSPGNGTNYLLLDRSSPTDGAMCLQIFDPTTTRVWDSLSTSPVPGFDLLNNMLGVTISPDGKLIAMERLADSGQTIMYLTNGIPDWSTIFTNIPATLANSAGFGSVCFDPAENLYAVSSGSLLRIYSLGLTTTCITSNDASTVNGSFQLIIPGSTVGVTASTPEASQGNPTPVPGVFTITRTGLTTQPLTVNFSLGGTATNGTYTITPANAAGGSILLPPNILTTNITITPVHDNLPRPTTTVMLTLIGGPTYSTILPGDATVTIANTGPQLLFVSGAQAPSMYLALSNDFASFTLTRWGDTNVTTTPSSGSFITSGSAVLGTDYTAPAVVAFNPGDVNQTVTINPLLNGAVPSHSSHPYVGNKTAIISYAGGASSSNAVLTIIDDADPPTPYLFYDPLTNNLTGGNPPTGNGTSDGYAMWNVTYANDNMDSNPGPDYDVEFGYWLDPVNNPNDTAGGFGEIPLPPNGATNCLRVTCNKGLGMAAGVNVFPTNVTFSGSYAIRFNMNLIQCGNTASATEGVLFGMNHVGIYTNWWAGGAVTDPVNSPYPWQSDGIWGWINADAGSYGSGDYNFFSGATGKLPNTGWMYLGVNIYAPTFANAFKIPEPYTTLPSITGDAGVPANQSPVNAVNGAQAANTWSDVELKQVGSNVTFSINKTAIFTYVNTNSFTGGTLMLGYNDPFDSLGSSDGAAYFSNLRVVRLGPLDITAITTSGGNVVITFTSTDGDDTTASFALQSTSVVTVSPADVSPAATFTQVGAGQLATFQVTYPQNGNTRFYRIRHL